MSLRRRLHAVAAATNDRVQADEGTITFMQRGDQDRRAGLDPDHAPLTLPITDHHAEDIDRGEGDRQGADFAGMLFGTDTVLQVSRDRFADHREPRPGDRVELFDGTRWVVDRVQDDRVARLLLMVSPVR